MAVWRLSRGTSGLASASWAQPQASCMGLGGQQGWPCSEHPTRSSRWGPLAPVGSES